MELNPKPTLESERSAGFSLIEVLMAIGILSFAAMFTVSVTLHLQKQSMNTSSSFQLEMFRRNLETLVLDSASWKSTVQSNSSTGIYSAGSMTCLGNSTPCTTDGSVSGTPITNQLFALVDGANDLFYNATEPSEGVNLFGLRCSNYPSDDCPFRFELRWSANCPIGACDNPQVKINARLEYAKPANVSKVLPLNPLRYSLPDTFRSAF